MDNTQWICNNIWWCNVVGMWCWTDDFSIKWEHCLYLSNLNTCNSMKENTRFLLLLSLIMRSFCSVFFLSVHPLISVCFNLFMYLFITFFLYILSHVPLDFQGSQVYIQTSTWINVLGKIGSILFSTICADNADIYVLYELLMYVCMCAYVDDHAHAKRLNVWLFLVCRHCWSLFI